MLYVGRFEISDEKLEMLSTISPVDASGNSPLICPTIFRVRILMINLQKIWKRGICGGAISYGRRIFPKP